MCWLELNTLFEALTSGGYRKGRVIILAQNSVCRYLTGTYFLIRLRVYESIILEIIIEREKVCCANPQTLLPACSSTTRRGHEIYTIFPQFCTSATTQSVSSKKRFIIVILHGLRFLSFPRLIGQCTSHTKCQKEYMYCNMPTQGKPSLLPATQIPVSISCPILVFSN